MAFFRPKHPLLKALFAFGSAIFYLLTVPFVRRQVGKVFKRPFAKTTSKVVDAKAEIIK